MKPSSLLSVVSLALAGCLGAAPEVDSLNASITTPYFDVAGEEAQGVELQGDVPGLDGVSYYKATDAKGDSLSKVTIEAGEIAAIVTKQTPTGVVSVPLRGVELKGAIFPALKSGKTIKVRIDAVEENPIWSITGAPFDATGKTFFYQTSYLIPGVPPAVDTWATLCKPNGNGDTSAVPVAATWNASGARVESTSLFTLGCVSGVIAKCEGWGYQPWMPDRELSGHPSVSMRDVHQTCTRTARADYCGNGVAHTYNDTHVNVFDLLSPPVKVDDQNEGAPHQMFYESAWRTNGAVCLSKPRWDNLPPPDSLCGDKTQGPYVRNTDDVIPYVPSICNSVAVLTGPGPHPWERPATPTLLVTESYIQTYPHVHHWPGTIFDNGQVLQRAQ
jgi:hypothetical protein